jgi:hypothetical protein
MIEHIPCVLVTICSCAAAFAVFRFIRRRQERLREKRYFSIAHFLRENPWPRPDRRDKEDSREQA